MFAIYFNQYKLLIFNTHLQIIQKAYIYIIQIQFSDNNSNLSDNNQTKNKDKMYMGKGASMAKKQAKEKKGQMAKVEMDKNAQKIKQLYAKFQQNLNGFAKANINEINSDSKFRDKFSEMCSQFDVNPMLAEKNIWTGLGFGDFYHHLAMKVLDICAKKRHENGGLMKIKQIIAVYKKKQKQQISQNDVVRAIGEVSCLGNASIVNKQYVCTIPIQLNNFFSQLLALSEKYGFVSAKLLQSEKKWSTQQFQTRILDLRKKGLLWVDKKVPNGPHYYFLSQLGADFQQFRKFMGIY